MCLYIYHINKIHITLISILMNSNTSIPLISCKYGVCVDYVLNKHHQDSFDKCASWHASTSLHIVRGDFCDPLPSPSFTRYNYLLTFIDEFSKHTWIYFLKIKSEVFDMFLSYKARVKKQFGNQLQR
jgi:hypothetical protein